MLILWDFDDIQNNQPGTPPGAGNRCVAPDVASDPNRGQLPT